MAEEKVLESIAQLNKRFDELNGQLNGKIEDLGDRLDKKIENLGTRLDSTIDNFDGRLNGKIDDLNGQLSGKIDNLSGRFDVLESSMEKYFGAVNVEFVAVREEMRRGFITLGEKDDVALTQIGEVLERVKHLEEDNMRAHSLDLHKRVRRIEKHLFETTR